MRGSMVDIQFRTAEIRRGKKERKKPQDENIYGLPYYIGRPVEPAALHAAAKNIIYFTTLAVLRGAPCPVLLVYNVNWLKRSA